MPSHLALVGFRGSGKTTLGAALAKRLGINFLDLDAEIERSEGISIKEIFTQRGEESFRDIESRLLESMCQSSTQTVIATGGGIILREINRSLLQNQAFTVFLDVPEKLLVKRLTFEQNLVDNPRPPLTSLPLTEEVHQLLVHRLPLYRKTAHLEVELKNTLIHPNLSILIEALREQGSACPAWLRNRLFSHFME
ncbi:MAG: shikimate kinase [Promethearchaeota archaeon]